jgi:mannose/fructose/N-acetylgalactosamine-specific phosphotransferase system component IIB
MSHLIVEEASEAELKKFADLVRKYRKKLVHDPKYYVNKTFEDHADLIKEVNKKRNISEVIITLRESAYKALLIDEAKFNFKVINELGQTYETPKFVLDGLITHADNELTDATKRDAALKELCSNYASSITQFFYILALSNTQARRSRAGKTFEHVIYKMYETLGYPFMSQQQFGRKGFEKKGLGKIVDSLLPSLDAFDSLKSKTIIGTMKTTLRERWQEVIEELSRTGLPKIYLLTMDDDIAASKSESMGEHNVIIVVPKSVKDATHLTDKHNIISFEDYFFDEIPPILEYWEKNPPTKR